MIFGLPEKSEHGFTLLEVVVATAIMALAFATLYPIFAVVPSRLAGAKHREEAVAQAEAILEEQILRHNWTALPVSDSDDDWQWQVEEVPLTDLPSEAIPGRALHLRVTLLDRSNNKDVVTLDRILWAQD